MGYGGIWNSSMNSLGAIEIFVPCSCYLIQNMCAYNYLNNRGSLYSINPSHCVVLSKSVVIDYCLLTRCTCYSSLCHYFSSETDSGKMAC